MAKKIFATIMVVAMLLGICLVAAACPQEKTRDVSIRIVRREKNKYASEVVFELVPDGTSNTTEEYIEYPYDGKEYYFEVVAYSVPDDPKLGDEWWSPHSQYSFSQTLYRISEDGRTWEEVEYFGGKGEYHYSVQPLFASTWTGWKYHNFIIHITVV